jgi:hypothetical protein
MTIIVVQLPTFWSKPVSASCACYHCQNQFIHGVGRSFEREPLWSYTVDGISRIPWIRVLTPQIPRILRHFTFTEDAHLTCARHILKQRQPIAPHMRLWRFFICHWISAHCSLIRKRGRSLRSLSLSSHFFILSLLMLQVFSSWDSHAV